MHSAHDRANDSEGKVLFLTIPFIRTSARKLPFGSGRMYAITHPQHANKTAQNKEWAFHAQEHEFGIGLTFWVEQKKTVSLRHLGKQNNAECA